MLLGIVTVSLTLAFGTGGLQDAVANGDTRTLSLQHAHTRETLTVTFRRDGRYDRAELQKLNWFLRDWRNDETVAMDPKLFDIVWAAQREAGSRGVIKVLSAYRSPNTNAMLRRRSSAVAKNSQHMQGKALDFSLPDADMARVRAIGMRLQRGGVGYYPNVPFVHLDSGSVRSWPRMPRSQLARLFPDGRTVHIPADGKPMKGFDQARRDIIARGDQVWGQAASSVASAEEGQQPRRRSFWAALFGGADEEEDEQIAGVAGRRQIASSSSAPADEDDNDSRRFFAARQSSASAQAQAPARTQAPTTVAAVQPAAPPPQQAPSLPSKALVIGAIDPRKMAAPATAPGEIPVTPAPQPVADAPLPVSRPDSLAGNAPQGWVTGAQPAQQASGEIHVLPQPPRRPLDSTPTSAFIAAQVAAVEAEGTQITRGTTQAAQTQAAQTVVAYMPLPPARPEELAPVNANAPLARDALSAIAAASPAAPQGADRSMTTAALSYAPMPPLPPVRPAQQAAVAKVVPQLPAPAARAGATRDAKPATAQQQDRSGLQQLFAMSATQVEPQGRARISTAKVAVADKAQNASAAAPMPTNAPQVVVQMGFTKNNGPTGLSTARFSGPAVAPLTVSTFSKD